METKKIKQEQLDRLIEANRKFRDLKFNIADIEINFERLKVQKNQIMANMEIAAHDLASVQEEIYNEYGDVKVNLQTGEFN
jgi:hypothetical protein